MPMKLEAILRLAALSTVLIAPSLSPVSSSGPHIGRCLEDELPSLLKIVTSSSQCPSALTSPTSRIETDRRVEGLLRKIEASLAAGNVDGTGRRIFFWPWRPRFWNPRWWQTRPFGLGGGAGIFGGIGPGGIGINAGIGTGIGSGYRPTAGVPGFGGTPGIGLGIGGGLGAGFRPGLGLGLGGGVGLGAGVVGPPPNQDHYVYEPTTEYHDDSWTNKIDDNAQSDTIDYPVLPPAQSHVAEYPTDASNGYEYNGPSAVGYDDRPDHVVGYGRTSDLNSSPYKEYEYLKPAIPVEVDDDDATRYDSNVNYETNYGDPSYGGSYPTVGNSEGGKKKVLQWYWNRESERPDGPSGYRDDYAYLKDREGNSYGRDEDTEGRDDFDDRPLEYKFFTDRDPSHADGGSRWGNKTSSRGENGETIDFLNPLGIIHWRVNADSIRPAGSRGGAGKSPRRAENSRKSSRPTKNERDENFRKSRA